MAPRHLTVLRKRHVLEFLVFLQDNKKLSPRTLLGYRHSIPFKEAFEINFADRYLSPKLGSISLRPLKENFPNGPSITLWKHSRPQDLGTAQPPWKTFSSNHLTRRSRLGQQMLGVGCMHQRGHLLWQQHCHHSYDRMLSLQSQTLDRMPPPVTFPSMATKHQLCPAFALSTYLTKSAHLPHKIRLLCTLSRDGTFLADASSTG